MNVCMIASGNLVYIYIFFFFSPGTKLSDDIKSAYRFHRKRDQKYINGVPLFSCLVSKPSQQHPKEEHYQYTVIHQLSRS